MKEGGIIQMEAGMQIELNEQMTEQFQSLMGRGEWARPPAVLAALLDDLLWTEELHQKLAGKQDLIARAWAAGMATGLSTLSIDEAEARSLARLRGRDAERQSDV